MAESRTEDMAVESNHTVGHYSRTEHIKNLFDYEPAVKQMESVLEKPVEEKKTPTALKYDNGKADLSLNPKIALEEMAKAFMLGEKKYGRYNFYNGMESHRLIAAAMRHLTAWNEGEDNDPESGNSHLGHVLACVAMMLQQQKLGTLKDTRYKG